MDLRAQILEEIRKIADANDGNPPGMASFHKKTGFDRSDWLGKYWARWGDAVKEAGFEPNAPNQRLTDREMLEMLIEAIRHFGRFPTKYELNMFKRDINPEFPSHTTLHKHFGSKQNLINETHEFVKADASLKDIRDILPQPQSIKRAAPPSSRIRGFVYLIKSGNYFKIGRTDNLERRIKEIKVQMPDATEIVHSIKTDDPEGIEAYWHNRFKDLRVRGEWFKLSSEDVAAFRRRKYQ